MKSQTADTPAAWPVVFLRPGHRALSGVVTTFADR